MDRAAFLSAATREYGHATAERMADLRFGKAVSIPEADVRKLEKQIEHECDVMMQKLGFTVIRFSHPGKTKQTPGIPDRRYYHPTRARVTASMAIVYFAVWVEFKSATGRQRPGQELFQELVTGCGEDYVLGGIDDLVRWLEWRGVAKRVGSELQPLETAQLIRQREFTPAGAGHSREP